MKKIRNFISAKSIKKGLPETNQEPFKMGFNKD